jgi:hypothetical protein
MFIPDPSLSTVFGHLLPILGIPFLAVLLGVLPGWWAARRITADSEIAVIIAGLVSFLLVYLASFAVYLVGGNQGWAVALIAGLSAFSGYELFQHHRDEPGIHWRSLALWYCAAMLFVGLQIFICAPGAPTGMWDWAEHWIRAKVFLQNEPLKTMVGGYSMAARGPLFNCFEAVCMSLVSNKEYWGYQLVAAALNTWFVIPFFVLLRQLCGIAIKPALIYAGISGLACYDISWSIIYPWTKIFVAGIILGAFAVYVNGCANAKKRLEALGLAGFSLAFLAHYLAFPFAILMWGHYGITRCLKDHSRLKTAAVALLASAAIVSSWFLPCFSALGFKQTLAANTTIGSFYVTTETGEQPSYAKAVSFNTASTFLPFKAISALGLDQWVPAPAQFLKWWIVLWHDGRQIQTEELPELNKPLIFSGLLGSFGNVGAFVILGILAFGFIRKIKLEPLSSVLGSKFWWLFWTVGIVLNAATLRFFCVGGMNGIIQAHLMLLLIAAMGFANRLPLTIKIGAMSLIGGNVLAMITRVIGIQSLAIPFINNQPQAVANTKIFTWHIQNSAFKMSNGAKLLFDLCETDRIPIAIATVLVSISILCVTALKSESIAAKPSQNK